MLWKAAQFGGASSRRSGNSLPEEAATSSRGAQAPPVCPCQRAVIRCLWPTGMKKYSNKYSNEGRQASSWCCAEHLSVGISGERRWRRSARHAVADS
jgi:hypothetical protein